jgi:hypothetical protein
VVGDLLLIGGFIKGAYNISKMNEISEKVETVRALVSTLQDHAAKEQHLRSQSEALRHRLEESAYEALKWSLIADRAPRYGVGDGRKVRDRVNTAFRRSMAALWAAHCASPEAATA